MSLIFIGDVHRKWDWLARLITKFPKKSTFIQVGDFGAGFAKLEDDKRDLENLNESLKLIESQMFVIRGNHDNTVLFTDFDIMSNIKLIKDYTVLDIDEKKILCIGGATSIDRTARKEGKTWWKNEIFKLDIDRIKDQHVDIVVTHTGSESLRPIGFSNLTYWFEKDYNLYRDLLHENEKLDLLDKNLSNRPKYWFCGHFHENAKKVFNNETHYIQLDELEIYQI